MVTTMRAESSVVISAVVFYLPLSVGCVLWGMSSDRIEISFLSGDWASSVWMMLAGVALAVVVVAFSSFSLERFAWAQRLSDRLRSVLGTPTRLQTAIIALASATGEELAFRGCLQPVLGLGWTALLFGALHGLFLPPYFAWSLFAFALGVVWGIMVDASGMLMPVILCHLLINYVNIRVICARNGESA